MKVTFVVPGFARHAVGGIRVVYSLANELVDLGHEASVVHVAWYRRPRIADRMYARQVREIISGTRDRWRGPVEEVTWHELDPRVERRYVARLRPQAVPEADAVVATAWQTAEFVSRLPASKGQGCYLIQSHEIWSGPAARVDATWELPLRKFFIAGWLFDLARERGCRDVHRLRPGLDLTHFRLLRPIEGRRPRVAMLASPWKLKGLADGLVALRLARGRCPELEAVLFGVGPRPPEVPEWIEYVQDPGQDELVSDVYNGSSVYLCPSRAEGWHLPPAEAMACGCAVVATRIDGVAEYAFDGRTALLSAPGNGRALGENLVDVLRDAELRTGLAEAGYRHIQEFSWGRSIQDFVDALAPVDARA